MNPAVASPVCRLPRSFRGALVWPLGLAFLAGGLSRAQPASGRPPAPERRAGSSDDIITLSEFAVRAEAQTGYVASESMTGSRIPTMVKDLPFNIDVLTSEFMDDFATQDYSKLFNGGMITSDQEVLRYFQWVTGRSSLPAVK